MTLKSPTFNIEEFELYGQTNPYLTEDQASAVNTVESRVNNQLNWLGQLLGWRGPNYWESLVYSVDQKRQLLGGFGGVYNSFTFPRVLEVRNWSNEIVIERAKGIKEGLTCYLNDKTAVISTLSFNGDLITLGFTDITDGFLDEFSSNAQFKVDIPENRPQPFVRPTPGISADTSFSVKADGSTLVLYPGWDVKQLNPYRYNFLIHGSRYFFDKPVFLSSTDSPFEPVVETKYDPDGGIWYFDLPPKGKADLSLSAYLVWPYSDSSTPLDVFCKVSLFDWVDPSDWNSEKILQNFSGVWGNKGGDLPFNFCFDSLSIHGFDENKSLFLAPIERTIPFNDLLNLVYYGKVPQKHEPPGDSNVGAAWWNKNTGVFSVFPPNVVGYGNWVEVNYRTNPDPAPLANYTYPTVADFEIVSASLPQGSVVRILDVTGLEAEGGTYQVQGITAPLPTSGEVLLILKEAGILYTIFGFSFSTELEFQLNAPYLPIGVTVRLTDSSSLKPYVADQYEIVNLEYEIPASQAYEVNLTKSYNMLQWRLSPSSLLKFIANTRLYDGLGDPEQGEMWWDFANPDPTTRSAATWYGEAWVQINDFPILGVAPGVVDFSAVGIYLNGALIAPDEQVLTDDYSFSFSVNSTGGFDFKYDPFTLEGKTKFPTVVVADGLTSAYRVDISPLIFSGVQYYMTPNVLDSETTLRVWKQTSLQVVSGPVRLENKVYQNPLLADINSGPADNWSRIFFRLPPGYDRSGRQWSQVELIAQDFTYYGSTLLAEEAKCPPFAIPPKLYDELVLYPPSVPYAGVIYDEAYLYSNVGSYANVPINRDYDNAGVKPTSDEKRNTFVDGFLVDYDPLHNRRADLTSPVLEGYGDWEGFYMQGIFTSSLSGYSILDIEDKTVLPIDPPIWDSSIYKYPTFCGTQPESFNVDMNNFKVGYAYFAADLSAAEDGFFDVQQDISWRDAELSAKTGYVLPG